eukprot:TRINITY_DN2124_c6_g1_i2.p1 TRINITY_DN2124_c6_g1~~TRINITY_DN2124_c6_g1_i2.p1  ORF type:complete len:203 (-),score=41.69 TRINITY_DN2124_c6_g1_i2:49-657(-)
MSAVVVFPFFGNSVRTSRSTLSNKSDRSSVRTSGGTRVSGSVAHLRDLVPPPLEEDEDECPEESTGMYFSLSNNEGGFEEEEPTPVSPSQRIRFIRARRTSDFKSDRSSSSSSSSNSSSSNGNGNVNDDLPMAGWSVGDVSAFLRSIPLSDELVESLANEGFDGRKLCHHGSSHVLMAELGIRKVGQRIHILRRVQSEAGTE